MNNKRIYPKKSLGQNYLVDDNICKNIVSGFDITSDDNVIEIGPGQGAITGHLLEKTRNLTVIEIDGNNCEILKNRYNNLDVIKQDILKTDIKSLAEKYNGKLRFIGNIPYNLTTEIIFRLIDAREFVTDAQLMIQEEVARRLAANPGNKDYGITSVLLQVCSEPVLKFKVSHNCFYPKPKVDSRIIYIDFTQTHEHKVKDMIFFKKFVKAAFSQRRKTLKNSLKILELDLSKADFDFSRRAETLELNEFIELSNLFC